jgi:hypothetical protein
MRTSYCTAFISLIFALASPRSAQSDPAPTPDKPQTSAPKASADAPKASPDAPKASPYANKPKDPPAAGENLTPEQRILQHAAENSGLRASDLSLFQPVPAGLSFRYAGYAR